jgi:hypothetical protein
MPIFSKALIVLSLLAFSCKKWGVQESVWVKGVVVDTNDVNCRAALVNFSEDTTLIRQFTGEAHFSFISRGLPAELNIRGKKIIALIEKPKPEEAPPCLTYGPNYPEIKIVRAAVR